MFANSTVLFVSFLENFTPIPQIYTHRARNLEKKIFEEISPFSRKTYIGWKLRQKWSSCDCEVLPLSYVTINQNFSPIPEICAPNTTILTKTNFWNIFQVCRKTYIVCKIGTKMVLLQFHIQCLPILLDYLLFLGNVIPIPQIYTQRATNLGKKIFFKKFARFPGKYIVWKLRQKWYCWEFEVLPPSYVTINPNFCPIPEIYTPITKILSKKSFWKISQFSKKTYIVCEIWTKMVLLGLWSVTP